MPLISCYQEDINEALGSPKGVLLHDESINIVGCKDFNASIQEPNSILSPSKLLKLLIVPALRKSRSLSSLILFPRIIMTIIAI